MPWLTACYLQIIIVLAAQLSVKPVRNQMSHCAMCISIQRLRFSSTCRSLNNYLGSVVTIVRHLWNCYSVVKSRKLNVQSRIELPFGDRIFNMRSFPHYAIMYAISRNLLIPAGTNTCRPIEAHRWALQKCSVHNSVVAKLGNSSYG